MRKHPVPSVVAMVSIFMLTLAALAGALIPSAVGAQPAPTATPGSPAATCTAGGTFSGDITAAGSNVTVRGTDGQDRTVAPGPNATIVKDGRDVAFADLKATDQVNVTTNADCTASRIEATSRAGERGFNPLWLLPLLLLPLLAIPFLRRKPAPAPVVVERETTVRPVRPVETVETAEQPAVTGQRVVRPMDGPDVTVEHTDASELGDTTRRHR